MITECELWWNKHKKFKKNIMKFMTKRMIMIEVCVQKWASWYQWIQKIAVHYTRASFLLLKWLFVYLSQMRTSHQIGSFCYFFIGHFYSGIFIGKWIYTTKEFCNKDENNQTWELVRIHFFASKVDAVWVMLQLL